MPDKEKTERFGAIAIRMGFATKAQVEEALKIQQQLRREGKAHKLVGIIMLENGILGPTELISILRSLPSARKAHSARKS